MVLNGFYQKDTTKTTATTTTTVKSIKGQSEARNYAETVPFRKIFTPGN